MKRLLPLAALTLSLFCASALADDCSPEEQRQAAENYSQRLKFSASDGLIDGYRSHAITLMSEQTATNLVVRHLDLDLAYTKDRQLYGVTIEITGRDAAVSFLRYSYALNGNGPYVPILGKSCKVPVAPSASSF